MLRKRMSRNESCLIALKAINFDFVRNLEAKTKNGKNLCLKKKKLGRLASAHAARVSREGYCKWPKPKLIQVPHHTSKTYTPHCTILHRCSDETGCCHVDYKTCQPLRKENVTLAFWVRVNFAVITHNLFTIHIDLSIGLIGF